MSSWFPPWRCSKCVFAKERNTTTWGNLVKVLNKNIWQSCSKGWSGWTSWIFSKQKLVYKEMKNPSVFAMRLETEFLFSLVFQLPLASFTIVVLLDWNSLGLHNWILLDWPKISADTRGSSAWGLQELMDLLGIHSTLNLPCPYFALPRYFTSSFFARHLTLYVALAWLV